MVNGLTEVPLIVLDPGETGTGTSAENKKSELLPFPNPRACQPQSPLSSDPASLPNLAEKGREVGWETGKWSERCAGMVYIHLKVEVQN